MTRQSHRRRLAGALLLGCSLVPVAEASLSTATLVASAASPSCISWRISGICYWLKCGWGGCRIRTSVRVSHFIPQAVVSAYHAPGENPWREMSLVSGAAGGIENAVTSVLSGVSAGGGNSEQKFEAKRKTALHFFMRMLSVIRQPPLSAAVFRGIPVTAQPHRCFLIT